MEKDNIKKILIIRYEHIGDYALTIPAIDSIRKKFPKARIDIVVGSWNKDFVLATPSIDNVIYFDNPLVKRNLGRIKIIKFLIRDFFKFIRYIKRINGEKYDLVINFSDRKFILATDKWIKAKKKILGVDLPYISGREVNRNNKLLRKYLRIKDFVKKGTIKYTEDDKNKVNDVLKKFNFKNKKIILIHPMTPLDYKNWKIENWVSLVDEMNKKYRDLFFILVGSPEQENQVKDIVERISLKNVGYSAGLLNIPQIIFLINKSELIIGGDSGPIHWAELTDAKIINLYGPTGVERWGPPKNQGIFLKKGNDVNNILVKDVMEKVKKFL